MMKYFGIIWYIMMIVGQAEHTVKHARQSATEHALKTCGGSCHAA